MVDHRIACQKSMNLSKTTGLTGSDGVKPDGVKPRHKLNY